MYGLTLERAAFIAVVVFVATLLRGRMIFGRCTEPGVMHAGPRPPAHA